MGKEKNVGKLTVGQKASRVLKLLLGLRKPRVVEALRQYGFNETDLSEGWAHLQALTTGRLEQRNPAPQDPTLLAQLDAWENRWFPVASATLRARFPKAHEQLFLNIAQTEGAEVILSVGTFLQRLDKLASDPQLGQEGKDARALLEQRGLNATTVGEAHGLLERLGSLEPPREPAPFDAAAQERAETAMWNWYLEWGEIARVAIRDRRLLRELGFLASRRTLREEVEDEANEAEDDEAEEVDAAS
jgi:hypothetical protein